MKYAYILFFLLFSFPALAQVNLTDTFDGSGGANAANWTYNWGAPALNGSGSLAIPAGGGPFGQGVSGFQSGGINDIPGAGFESFTTTIEIQITCPSSAVSFWFGRSDFGSWGTKSKVVKWGPAANGKLELDSWQGSGIEDSGIAYPVGTPFRLRQVTDFPTGGPAIQRYFYNFTGTWVEYIPTDAAYKTFAPGSYTWLLMNQSSSDEVLIGEYILSQVNYTGPVLTPTPTPTPSPTPSVADAVVEDLFNLTSGTAPRADLWTYNWGSPHHDGNGFLVVTEAGGPFGQGIGALAAPFGTLSAAQITSQTYTLELYAKLPATGRMWFGYTDFGSWGDETKVVTWGTESSGNLALDSWQGSDLEDTGIPFPVDTLIGLRIQLVGSEVDTSATRHFFYNFGAGWLEYHPVNTAFITHVGSPVIPIIMNESAGTSGPILLDTYRLRKLTVLPPVNSAKRWELY